MIEAGSFLTGLVAGIGIFVSCMLYYILMELEKIEVNTRHTASKR